MSAILVDIKRMLGLKAGPFEGARPVEYLQRARELRPEALEPNRSSAVSELAAFAVDSGRANAAFHRVTDERRQSAADRGQPITEPVPDALAAQESILAPWHKRAQELGVPLVMLGGVLRAKVDALQEAIEERRRATATPPDAPEPLRTARQNVLRARERVKSAEDAVSPAVIAVQEAEAAIAGGADGVPTAKIMRTLRDALDERMEGLGMARRALHGAQSREADAADGVASEAETAMREQLADVVARIEVRWEALLEVTDVAERILAAAAEAGVRQRPHVLPFGTSRQALETWRAVVFTQELRMPGQPGPDAA